MSERLVARQAALVAALVAGAAVPGGFDPGRVAVAAAALLRKRAGEVAAHWPVLAAEHGAGWPASFATWAEGRPPRGPLRDGWDLARELYAAGRLPRPAGAELAAREAVLRYDGESGPRPRRRPAVRGRSGSWVLQVYGRPYLLWG